MAFIRREGYCNAWHPMAGGWGKECLRVICQAPRSRETSSLEMVKKLALLEPGVPRSHGAELSKCCTMKSLAKASNGSPQTTLHPGLTAVCPQATCGQKAPAAIARLTLPHPHPVCCHHPTPLPEVGLSVCSDGELAGWATCQLCIPCQAQRSGCSPEVD